MSPLTPEFFNSWMTRYGNASRENDPKASAALFTTDAEYYETPFTEPLAGQSAIFEYWEKGAINFKDKRSTHEILSWNENTGIAHWRSQFTKIATGEDFELDCIFLVEFAENGKCKLFREWWHIQIAEKKFESVSRDKRPDLKF